MNLYCKCGSRLGQKDFNIDPTGTWCVVCYSWSEALINDNNEEEIPQDLDGFKDED